MFLRKSNKPFGAIKRPKDKRDFKLGKVQAPIEIPKIYMPDLSVYQKYFQNGIPACGAHAGAILKVIQETKEYGHPVSFSPRFLWSVIKNKYKDGYALEDGTDMRSIFETLKTYGICDFDFVGNDVSLSLENYTNASLTPSILDNAHPRVIKSYAFIDDGGSVSIQDLKQAIYQNGAVLILISLDNGFFGTKNPVFTTKKYRHFVVAANYDEDSFYIIDSTEKDFSFSVKRMLNKDISFVIEAGTAVDLPDEVIILQKQIIAKAQTVVGLLAKLKLMLGIK